MSEMDVYRALGAAVAKRRKALGLTQADVAERGGMSRAALANIETGRTKVLLHQVYVLAAALGLDGMSGLLPERLAEPVDAVLPRIDAAKVTPAQRGQIEGVMRRALTGGGRIEKRAA